MPGRVADEDLDLGLHPGGLVLFSAYHSEGPHPLAVQAHVLGEALGEKHVVALINEVSVGKCVLVHISGGEALVGHVEVGEALLVDQGRHLLPLLGGGVHASGVVSVGVQEDDGTLRVRDVRYVIHGPGEVEAVMKRVETLQNGIKEVYLKLTRCAS